MKKKETIEIGYKALSIHRPLMSWSSPHRIQYKPRGWTYPQKDDGPLAVFKTEQAAVDFIIKHSFTDDPHNLIYKCKYVRSEHKHLWITLPGGRKSIYLDKLPKDTILADKVRLIK